MSGHHTSEEDHWSRSRTSSTNCCRGPVPFSTRTNARVKLGPAVTRTGENPRSFCWIGSSW